MRTVEIFERAPDERRFGWDPVAEYEVEQPKYALFRHYEEQLQPLGFRTPIVQGNVMSVTNGEDFLEISARDKV